jgi:hypothetical protein
MGFSGFFCFKNSGFVFNERVGLYFYDGQININSQNLNILSSQDTNNTKSSTKHKNWVLVVFFVLKIVVLFLMRGWGYIFTIKG